MRKTFLSFIKFYQLFISPSFGQHCRFYPSCSEYCYLVIQKYGVLKGGLKGVKRILKCGPWNRGGIDLPR